MSCESIEDIFDELNVKAYVKSDLENFSSVAGRGDGEEAVGASLFSFWLFYWPLSLSQFICCYNKNKSLSSMPTSPSFLEYD